MLIICFKMRLHDSALKIIEHDTIFNPNVIPLHTVRYKLLYFIFLS